MDIRIFLTDVGFTLSILISFGAGVLVYTRGRGKPTNRSFFLLTLAVTVFQLAHVVGINLTDGELSRFALMFTSATIFTACFTTELVHAVIGELQKRRRIMRFIYSVGLGLLAFFVFFPSNFLLSSRPKLYLPNYYAPGPFYWLLITFFALTALYFFGLLVSHYLKSADKVVRNRIKYFFLSILFGYTAGSFGFLLVYDIPIDPIWMVFIGLYTMPLAYGILKYELMDIRVVAKQAFIYAVFVGAASFVINAVSVANNFLIARVPRLSPWLLPVITSVFAVGIGALVWRRLREVDALKYEFITVVTHKFRTPLTYVKWALENLQEKKLPPEEQASLRQISEANRKLVQLTDVLVGLTRTEDVGYRYVLASLDFQELITNVVAGLRNKYREKRVELSLSEEERLPSILADVDRLSFVLQVLLENALVYTPAGGNVYVSVRRNGGRVTGLIKDSGIGVTRQETPRVFQKFFRGVRAKLADTEGLGIGLFIARSIIKRHRGKIWFESAGEGKGTTFFVSLPIARSQAV